MVGYSNLRSYSERCEVYHDIILKGSPEACLQNFSQCLRRHLLRLLGKISHAALCYDFGIRGHVADLLARDAYLAIQLLI